MDICYGSLQQNEQIYAMNAVNVGERTTFSRKVHRFTQRGVSLHLLPELLAFEPLLSPYLIALSNEGLNTGIDTGGLISILYVNFWCKWPR
jgi:hypothetical protein